MSTIQPPEPAKEPAAGRGAYRDLKAAVRLTELDATDLEPVQLKRLRQLSISTNEELLGLISASPEASASFLDLRDLSRLQARLARRSAMPAAAADAFTDVRFALGALPPARAAVRSPNLERNREAIEEASRDSLDGPPVVDLRSCMNEVRDQGDRGTCVAHAVAAVFECEIRRAGWAPIDLSEQFLYFDAKERDGNPTQSGTYIEVAAGESVPNAGVCTEGDWPYNPIEASGNEGQGPAPAAAIADAATRVARPAQTPEQAVDQLKQVLADGHPIAISVPVFDNWYSNSATHVYGFIPLPMPLSKLIGGHAMCAVGYGLDDQFAGGGYFIVRNSWGATWAPLSPLEAGYGALPFAYVAGYAWEAWGLRRL